VGTPTHQQWNGYDDTNWFGGAAVLLAQRWRGGHNNRGATAGDSTDSTDTTGTTATDT
jgi:hypothetical protein